METNKKKWNLHLITFQKIYTLLGLREYFARYAPLNDSSTKASYDTYFYENICACKRERRCVIVNFFANGRQNIRIVMCSLLKLDSVIFCYAISFAQNRRQ